MTDKDGVILKKSHKKKRFFFHLFISYKCSDSVDYWNQFNYSIDSEHSRILISTEMKLLLVSFALIFIAVQANPISMSTQPTQLQDVENSLNEEEIEKITDAEDNPRQNTLFKENETEMW